MDQTLTNRTYLVVGVVAAAFASVLFAAAFPHAILAGDADPYRQRMIELFSGNLPYVDFSFEHLPMMIIPMGLAWVLGGFQDLRSYAFALAAVSAICLMVTGLLLRRIEIKLGFDGLAIRWLLLVVPLMPFLLFRNDSFVVMLIVGGILSLVGGREARGFGLIAAAVLAKLWPAAWAVVEWWRGKRWQAVALAIAGFGALAITMSPGVQSIQDPRGLHTETLAGSAIGAVRSLWGADLRLTATAAVYIEAPRWTLVADGVVGLAVVGVVLLGLRDTFRWPQAWAAMGALVGAGLIASPFFSTQYVVWLTPFAALEARTARPMLAVSVASLLLITTWDEMFNAARWWWLTLFGRNIAIVAIALLLAKGISSSSQGRASRSKGLSLAAPGT